MYLISNLYTQMFGVLNQQKNWGLTVKFYLHFHMYIDSNGLAREMVVSEYLFE